MEQVLTQEEQLLPPPAAPCIVSHLCSLTIRIMVGGFIWSWGKRLLFSWLCTYSAGGLLSLWLPLFSPRYKPHSCDISIDQGMLLKKKKCHLMHWIPNDFYPPPQKKFKIKNRRYFPKIWLSRHYISKLPLNLPLLIDNVIPLEKRQQVYK